MNLITKRSLNKVKQTNKENVFEEHKFKRERGLSPVGVKLLVSSKRRMGRNFKGRHKSYRYEYLVRRQKSLLGIFIIVEKRRTLL